MEMEGWIELKIKRKNVLNVGGKGVGNVMEDMINKVERDIIYCIVYR